MIENNFSEDLFDLWSTRILKHKIKKFEVPNNLLLKLIRKMEKNDKDLTINLGTGSGHSVFEIIKMTEAISKRKINYKVSKRRDGDPDVVIASSEKAKQLINWSPSNSDLRNIIGSTWKIYNR